MRIRAIIEAIVIGAGPAGLTSALYLARYLRHVVVIHDSESRAVRIPKTHNAPGFPDGVTGPDLIQRMTRHAQQSGATFVQARITTLKAIEGGYELTGQEGTIWTTRCVILATGIRMNEVDLPHEVHEQAIADGVLRYCPICDGYEHRDQNIGVLGCDSNGAAEALFLRQFSDRVTLMTLNHPDLTPEQTHELHQAKISIVTGSLERLRPMPDGVEVVLDSGSSLGFDVVYPALGGRPRSELASQLGLQVSDSGCVAYDCVTGHTLPGFFAAGDVVEGLDQLSVAMGHGALAATRAHNWLRAQDHEVLQHRD